jgi:hypothetical protein
MMNEVFDYPSESIFNTELKGVKTAFHREVLKSTILIDTAVYFCLFTFAFCLNYKTSGN